MPDFYCVQLLKILGQFQDLSKAGKATDLPPAASISGLGSNDNFCGVNLLSAQPPALESSTGLKGGASALKQARQLMAAEVDRLANTSAVMGEM